jgi:hypothetical protein
MGKSDEELSYIVTNWTNFPFIESSNFLHGCQSLRHSSGVNINPLDTVGGALVNRPVMAINMSAKQELCLSYFPSLRNEQETLEIAREIKDIFSKYQC